MSPTRQSTSSIIQTRAFFKTKNKECQLYESFIWPRMIFVLLTQSIIVVICNATIDCKKLMITSSLNSEAQAKALLVIQFTTRLARIDHLSDVFFVIISYLIPPLGVWFDQGLGWQFFLNIILTLLGYIPGFIHAVIVICCMSGTNKARIE